MSDRVKTRGTQLWIGTKAENHLADTYTQVPGTVQIQGNIGPQWTEMDVTELTDTDAQIEKNLRNQGRLTFTGNLHQEVASGTVAGLVALEAAANDAVPGNYNVMLVKSNGRRKYLKVGIFQFQETYGSGANVNGFTCLMIVRAAPSELGPVAEVAPVNTLLPSISGIAQEGEVLTAVDGIWTGAETFTYQWQEDDSGWADIGGATSKTYTPVAGNVGNPLRVVVTAANGAGSAPATSAPTADVLAA